MSRKIEDENRKRTTGRRKIAAGSRRTNQVRQGIEVMNLDQKETERPRSSMRRSKKSGRNLEFLIITYLFLAIFIGMISYFIYFQMVKSESVINSSYNSRLDLYAEHVIRGDITTADGTVLAKTTVSDDGSETREYPYGRMFAHVVGYTNNGKGGLESQYNFNLLRSHSFFLTQIINDLKNKKNIGDTLVTTLDYDVQETAYKALEDRDGAVVVMEVKTGKILALVSKPDFDPNTLAERWDDIVSDENSSVLLNRVTSGLYPPGSTFKIFTTLEYVHENSNYQDYSFDCEGELNVDGNEIHCYHKAVVQHLFAAIFCEMMGYLNKEIADSEKAKLSKEGIKQADHILRKFMELLSKDNGMHRSVTYFADALCYTPKHFSKVIKQACGRAPLDLINETAIEHIKYRLKHSDKSIKEIAEEFNFPNQSFFGKFFKRCAGMSPKEYTNS